MEEYVYIKPRYQYHQSKLFLLFDDTDDIVELHYLVDSGINFCTSMIDQRLVDLYNLKINDLGFCNADFVFVNNNNNNHLQKSFFDLDNIIPTKRIPHNYDIVMGLGFIEASFRNGIIISPANIGFNIKPIMIPYQSSNVHKFTLKTPNHKNLSIYFDTGSYGSFDLMINRKTAISLLEDNVLFLTSDTRNIWNFDKLYTIETAGMYFVYFVYQDQSHKIVDIQIYISDEINNDDDILRCDVLASCEFMEKLYQKTNFLVCGIE